MMLITYLTMCHSIDSHYSAMSVASPDSSSTLIYDIFGSDTDSDLEEGGRRGSGRGSGRGVSGRGPVIDLTADFEHLFTTVDDAAGEEDEDDDDASDDDSTIDLSYCMHSQYLGLKQLAYIFGISALRLTEAKRVDVAEQLYLDALHIDPYNDFIGNMAIMYESHINNVELAEKYYLMAIDNEDEIAMYNLADMYRNQHKISLMVRYFEMAAQLNDIGSRKRLIMHYHKETDMSNFAKHYYAHLSLGDFDDDDDDDFDDDDNDFRQFQLSNSNLAIAKQIDLFVKHHTDVDAHVLQLCEYLHQLPEYCALKNKIALFTRLNHVVECGICYDDDKVNIDIHCGHTVCVDCYTMVYNKACPFCRQEPLVA